jgi:hypothetical protein
MAHIEPGRITDHCPHPVPRGQRLSHDMPANTTGRTEDRQFICRLGVLDWPVAPANPYSYLSSRSSHSPSRWSGAKDARSAALDAVLAAV